MNIKMLLPLAGFVLFGLQTVSVASHQAWKIRQERRAQAIVFRDLIKELRGSDTPIFLSVGKNNERNPHPQARAWIGYQKFTRPASQLAEYRKLMRS